MSPNKIITTPSGQKTYLSTPNPFEKKFGYYRAVRKGPFIYVSGTTALKFVGEEAKRIHQDNTNTDKLRDGDEDRNENDQSRSNNETETALQRQSESEVHYPDSSYDQAIVAMERCIDAVEKLGGKVRDIVRVKMFVGRSEYCGDVGNAFRKCFGGTTGEDGRGGEIGAAATMIVVQDGFVDKDIRVEVEVDAVVL